MTTLQELAVASGAEPYGENGYIFEQGAIPQPFDIKVSVTIHCVTFFNGETTAVTLALPDEHMLDMDVREVRLA
jgi:hypothetical protein